MIREFPFCCTAMILCDFGGTLTSEGDIHHKNEREITFLLKEALYYEEMGFFCATTNDEQKEANKVLRKMGFSYSQWFSKEQHEDTRVRLWYISKEKLFKALEEV